MASALQRGHSLVSAVLVLMREREQNRWIEQCCFVHWADADAVEGPHAFQRPAPFTWHMRGEGLEICRED